jgi:hypothetical protein
MAAFSFFAELQQLDNPYAAPQTRELVLPQELERAERRTTSTEEILPRTTQRWLNAALIVYWLAFVVPLVRSWDSWMPFIGTFFFIMGALMCWHPFMFAWWANVFFVLSRRNLYRGRSQRACVYAGIGVLAAASFMVLGMLSSGSDRFIFHLSMNPPYLCWLAAMILQWIAAVDMRQFNREQLNLGFVTSHDQSL